MPDRAIKILVVQGSAAAAPLPVPPLGEGGLPPGVVERVVAPTEALDRVDGDAVDLVILDIGSRGVDDLANIGEIRQRAPSVPIIVVTDASDDAVALSALRAGAQDCLARREMEENRPLLARAVRFAIERTNYLNDRERIHHEAMREHDVQALLKIFGGPKLPVTERSLGQTSLRERHAADFRRLVQDYEHILDDMVSPAPGTGGEETIMALNVIADRLGLLGAGPRDVVELHKAALAPHIESRDSHTARRALNYIEEGKLLVLRLMGQLVSFYRSQSWGTKPPAAAGRGRAAPPAEPSIKDR
jgi:CheY-like chemotaxis protein